MELAILQELQGLDRETGGVQVTLWEALCSDFAPLMTREKVVESHEALIIVIYGTQSCASPWLVRARCYDRKTPLMRKPLLIRTIVLFLFLDRNLAVDILCDFQDMSAPCGCSKR